MTLRDFLTWLTTTFPKATWIVSFEGSIQHTPAHTERWGTQAPKPHPMKEAHEVSYRLRFQRDYFDKEEQASTYEAPSLEALQAVMVAHYQSSVEQVCRELEDL